MRVLAIDFLFFPPPDSSMCGNEKIPGFRQPAGKYCFYSMSKNFY